MSGATLVCDAAGIRMTVKEFFDGIRTSVSANGRLLTLYGSAEDDGLSVALTAVMQNENTLRALRTSVVREAGYHALTTELPAAHIFEREIHEECQVKVHGHPWLKPVRFSGSNLGKTGTYPFFKIDGKEVHEVGVGPIHAGVIEPGHFRFMCLGEVVHHLEIQLGFQHRGVEALLLARPPWALTPLVETIAGDSSVAHAWAFCDALEALAAVSVSDAVCWSRGIALELERVAMHLAGLAGLCADIAFLQGAATYGRLRTTAINTSMLLCGSRFGRGWLKPGGAQGVMSATTATAVRQNLALLSKDIAIINEHFQSARTVRHRLSGVGVVTAPQAQELGLVGMAARASGVAMDARALLPGRPYAALPVEVVVEPAGDCWARASLRIREIDVSLRWLAAALDQNPSLERSRSEPSSLTPNSLAIAVREGWRGEVVHCLETDGTGTLKRYRVQDPSLRNWFGLAMALRSNAISDFPICNKSFDLSYCGNDL